MSQGQQTKQEPKVIESPLEALGALAETAKKAYDFLPDAGKQEAAAVATGVTLDNTDKLLEYTGAARKSISDVSDEMIGDRKVGEVDHINALLTDFITIERELDVKAVHKKQGMVKGFLSSIPWIG